MCKLREQELVSTTVNEGCLDSLNKEQKDEVSLHGTNIAFLDGSLHVVPGERLSTGNLHLALIHTLNEQ